MWTTHRQIVWHAKENTWPARSHRMRPMQICLSKHTPINAFCSALWKNHCAVFCNVLGRTSVEFVFTQMFDPGLYFYPSRLIRPSNLQTQTVRFNFLSLSLQREPLYFCLFLHDTESFIIWFMNIFLIQIFLC